jgi:hypothetical protein
VGIVQNSIGFRWEKILHDKFPDLMYTSGDNNVPDFYHPSGFWVEAKAGNIRWGGRIKQYQLDQIRDFNKPVVYAFGMHNFDNAIKRLGQKTERGRQNYLKKNMSISETYFISSDIIRGILDHDSKVSEKGMRYCMVKPSALRNVILDRPFKRQGVRIESSAEYYGFNRDNYYIYMSSGRGCILHKDIESQIIDFLRQNH